MQVKGAASAHFTKAGTHSVDVEVAHINYWAAIHLPVVALLVDTSAKRLYWTSPTPIVGDSKAKLVFTSGQCLNDDLAAFRQTMYQLARWPASTAVLDHVEHFVGVFLQLQGAVGERDFGFAVDDAELGSIELLYDHLLRLRGVLGLTQPTVLPLPFWLDRSQYAEEATGRECDGELFDAVAGEILAYLKPIYMKTLVHLGEIAQHESVIASHRRLAGYAASGYLEPSHLAALFDPWQPGPSICGKVTYSRGGPEILRSRDAQKTFDLFLHRSGIRRINLSGSS